MKREVTFSIFITIFLAIVAIVGSTYAYYSLVASGNNRIVNANSEIYEIIYHGGDDIGPDSCPMGVVASKDDGCNTTVEIGLAQGMTVAANANIYIDVISISDNLKIAGFKWETYKLNGQTETLVSSGNFTNIPNDNKILAAANQPLSTTLAQYKIYFWLDGELVDNDILGASFSGAISASTDVLTGIVNNS